MATQTMEKHTAYQIKIQNSRFNKQDTMYRFLFGKPWNKLNRFIYNIFYILLGEYLQYPNNVQSDGFSAIVFWVRSNDDTGYNSKMLKISCAALGWCYTYRRVSKCYTLNSPWRNIAMCKNKVHAQASWAWTTQSQPLSTSKVINCIKNREWCC